MIYELRIDKCLGRLFTGRKKGNDWAEGNIPKGSLPSKIDILHKGEQIITSSFYLGVFEWFKDNFEFEGEVSEVLKRITYLRNVDDTNLSDMKRALKRL